MAPLVKSAREIFLDAVEKTDSLDRGNYLRDACGADADLRRHVEALLRVHNEPDSLLDQERIAARVVIDREGASSLTIDQPPERLGTQIGPYKLLQVIGEGGMGVVYMAEQTEPVQRKVALKVIKPGMDSAQVIARFEAERQALAVMDHVNIARVFDAGATDAGRPFFVMELVHGVPITKYCDDNRLTPRQRLELFVPVCQAIQHAHQKGIIHRDIKPSNVMVTLYDGKPVPKVIDFGVAKATEQKLTERTLFTQYGTMVGTLEYMSPEQAEMSALGVDTRSDIYALGVLLYELLTGNTPLTHMGMKEVAYAEILRMIKEDEPPKPSTRLSDSGEALASISANRHMEPAKLTRLVRGELDWIVMKTLEKDRSRRYETAKDFAADVQRYLDDEPVQACPPSAGYRLRKFARRNKGPVLAASLVLAALVIGIVGATWGMIRATHAEADAVREAGEKTVALGEKTVALGEKETALAIAKASELEAHKQEALAKKQETLAKENAQTAREQELLARRRFYAAQTNLAQQAWEAGQPARALELLESQRPKLDQEDLRGFDWYYLWRLCHRNLHRTLSGPKGPVYTLAIAPDGKTLVSGSGGADGGIRVWDVDTGKERAVLSGHKSMIWRLAISPDGKMVASASMDATVKLWDLGTSQLLATLPARTPYARSVAFSPDGNVLAVGMEDGALELWDMGARKRRLTLPAHFAPTIALAYSPDGKMLATGAGWSTSRGLGGTKVWDVTSEPPRITFQPQAAGPYCAAFSPDSKLLATGAFGDAKVWSVPSGELKATFESGVNSLAFSADGNTLVLGGNDRTVKLWEFATGATRTVGIHLGHVNAVAFFPHGDLVASGSNDGNVKLWHAGPLQDAASFAHKTPIRSLAFTPDSKLLVVGSSNPTTVLDAATGKETTTLAVGGVLAASADANLLAAWAPDHKRLIWDVAAARARAELPVGPDLSGAAFSGDGKTLVTWGGDSEAPQGTVRLWDLATSRVRLALKLVGFSFGQIYSAAFSPDGGTLAIGHQFGIVTLYDTTTGQRRMILQQHEGPTRSARAVAFSNDGKLLAAGNDEGILRLWNVETGELKVSFKGHTDNIGSVAFSPDDKTLLSGSADRTARLWDVATGQERLAFKEHKSPVHLVAFAPDGKRLATASHNEVKLWLAATEPEATAFRMELHPHDADSPRATNNWGDRLQEIRRPQEAENAYRRAQARLEKLAAALPDAPDYQAELAYCQLASGLMTDPPAAAGQSQRQFGEIGRTLPADRRFALALRLHRLGHTHEQSGQADQAIGAYSKSIELAPEKLEWHIRRGSAYAQMNEWQKAAEDFDVGRPLLGANTWYLSAILRLQLGQNDNYQEICTQMIERFGQSASADDTYWIVWTCVLRPDAVADWTKPLTLAEKALADDGKNYDKINHLGAVLYRAGRFQEAAQRLTEAEAAFKQSPSTTSSIVYNWLFQAIAHQRLGHGAEAASWLQKAVQDIDKPETAQDPAQNAWSRRLTLQLLRREAEELLKKESGVGKQESEKKPD